MQKTVRHLLCCGRGGLQSKGLHDIQYQKKSRRPHTALVTYLALPLRPLLRHCYVKNIITDCLMLYFWPSTRKIMKSFNVLFESMAKLSKKIYTLKKNSQFSKKSQKKNYLTLYYVLERANP
jgi:hypothetical protein